MCSLVKRVVPCRFSVSDEVDCFLLDFVEFLFGDDGLEGGHGVARTLLRPGFVVAEEEVADSFQRESAFVDDAGNVEDEKAQDGQ